MDRRTLLALLLTAIVIVATPIIFPAPRRPLVDTMLADSAASVQTPAAAPSQATPATPAPAATTPGSPRTVASAPALTPVALAETTTVRTDHAEYGFVSPGGVPASVALTGFESLRPGIARQARVNLLEEGDRLVHLRLATDRDTIALDTVSFRAMPAEREGAVVVQSFTSTTSTIPVTLTYRLPTDSFVVHLEGRVGDTAAARDWRVLLQLPSRVRSEEANVEEDVRSLAVAYKKGTSEVESTWFRDLDSAVATGDTGAIRWIAERNKYFLFAAIPRTPDTAFRAVSMRAGPRQGEDAVAAQMLALMDAGQGRFGFTLYAGPQTWEHLRVTALDLENVNPYGGWFQGMVQPFSTIVMRMLLWMRRTLDVSYGWVLVIFGVAVRLLLWPLNQNAMRSSLKMQRIQPELAEIQKRYRDNPERQREAMMKLYQEHGMNPFSPILGCLPMLLPMPILFALYFVFQNTIEFRGVPFLWLPDLSLKDPTYITPIFMGISMFLLSWIGMRGMPPSPQAKMMAYVMPVMMTVIFWNFASGLNLYYAVQNVAALPQQWMLSRERSAQSSNRPAAVAAQTSPPRRR